MNTGTVPVPVLARSVCTVNSSGKDMIVLENKDLPHTEKNAPDWGTSPVLLLFLPFCTEVYSSNILVFRPWAR
jgi:hypothetical protein